MDGSTDIVVAMGSSLSLATSQQVQQYHTLRKKLLGAGASLSPKLGIYLTRRKMIDGLE